MAKDFDPEPLFQDFRRPQEKQVGFKGDRRDGKVYKYSESLVLSINLALATGRPLLLRGAPGCGKSSVAYNVARVMKRRYYEMVITSRNEARELFWRFDAVRRLGDAQVYRAAQSEIGDALRLTWQSYYPYIDPGMLWWVFDRTSAKRRGLPSDQKLFFQIATDPVIFEPKNVKDSTPSVVLIDEIDKAEPDVPNNLLVALGSLEFYVEEIQRTIRFGGEPSENLSIPELPLVLITTNEERQLPKAFLRRCIIHSFDPVETDELIDLANRYEGPKYKKIYEAVASAIKTITNESSSSRDPFKCSAAEYLDAIRACMRLLDPVGDKETRIDQQEIIDIVKRTAWKRSRPV